ncbi:hypothetical protein MLD38_031010 [Melastoma candidum]|uniref:Uncharacterized protein n=1 Tax=Melastoma candidum TaxID=119954 RepID=A0ACB9MND5_9MYRT|nr:hypothetical protein MLD38_031010 [Melastoma candidum]
MAEPKNSVDKLRKEVDGKERLQQKAKLKFLEEESARRLEETIRKNVEKCLNSEEVKFEIERRIEISRKKLSDDVEAQLKREKEAALVEAKSKEEKPWREREKLNRMQGEIRQLKQKQQELIFALQEVERRYDLTKAAELSYATIQEVEAAITQLEGSTMDNLISTKTVGQALLNRLDDIKVFNPLARSTEERHKAPVKGFDVSKLGEFGT